MKKCGAKTKSGKSCQITSVMENGRCRLHGGATPKGIASPHFKTGKSSKYIYLPKNYAPRLENTITDFITNLEESIAIQKALETRYLEKLGTNESTEAWSKLRKAVSDYDDATHKEDPKEKAIGQAQAFGMIRFIVEDGLSESFLHSDIQRLHEGQRKLSETLSKVRKESQEIYTQEQWMEMLSFLLQIIKNNVKDRKILNNIQTEINAKSVNNNSKQLANNSR